MNADDDEMLLVDSFGVDDGELGDIPNHAAFVLGAEYAMMRQVLIDESETPDRFGRCGGLVHEENVARLREVAKRLRLRVSFTPETSSGFYTMTIGAGK